MKSPALTLQRLGRHILLVRVLSVVKDVEEGVRVDLAVQAGIIDRDKRLLWIITRR